MVQNEKFSNEVLNVINLCSKHSKCPYTYEKFEKIDCFATQYLNQI